MLLLFSALDLWLFKHFRLKRKLKSFSAWFATPSQTKPLSIGNIGCADVGHTEKRSNFCWFEAWTERRSKSFRWQSDRILDNIQKWGCPSFPVLLARVLLPDGGIRALAALCRLQDRQSAKKTPNHTKTPFINTTAHRQIPNPPKKPTRLSPRWQQHLPNHYTPKSTVMDLSDPTLATPRKSKTGFFSLFLNLDLIGLECRVDKRNESF